MSSETLIFPHLTLERGLQLLVAAAAVEKGRYLSEINLSGRLSQAPLDRASDRPTVTLAVPKYPKRRVGQHAMLDAMYGFCEEQGWNVKEGGFPESLDEPGAKKIEIPQLITAALTSRRGDPSRRGERVASRKLLAVAEVQTAAEVAEHFQVLAFHATNVRVAIAERSETTELALFDVKDDRVRHSTVSSVIATDVYPELSWLLGHRTKYGSIYLPQDWHPTDEILNLVGEFVRGAPAFFDSAMHPNPIDAPLLAVLAERGTTGQDRTGHQLLYLPALRFADQYNVAERASDYAHVDVVPLVSSTELDTGALRDAIREAYPPVGYRLRLKRTRLALYPYSEEPEQADREEQRLIQSINDLHYQLAFLRSTRVPRPVLLRFTPAQLPAMADFLRQVEPKLLQPPQSYDSPESLPLRYGFQAISEFPAGYHYLLVSPDAATPIDYAHLTRWGDLEDAADMRFWLDPSWAAYGPDIVGPCYVFVPHGMTLFPALHSREVADLNDFLRATFSEWLHDQGRLDVSDQRELPEVPLYLFECANEGDGQTYEGKDIRVSVLDQQQFGPLSVRLPWLNANLVLHTEMCSREFWQRVEEYTSAAADEKVRMLLLNQKKEAYLDAQQGFEQAAKQVRDRVTQAFRGLATAISDQLERIAGEATESAADAQRLNRQLRRLKNDYELMLDSLSDVKGEQNVVKKKASEARSRAAKLDAEVKEAVADTGRAIDHMEEVVREKLTELEAAERRERDRLANIQFRLWRS